MIATQLLLFLSYLLICELCEAFATQAANISAFWLPAGVGLAFVMLFNWRALPAIWLGAFVSNLIEFEPNTGLAFPALPSTWFLSSLADACLAVVSGLLGWLPLARIGASPYPFNRVLHTSVFIIGSAGVASAIVAAVGTLLLLANGQIDGTQFTMTWATWATGDAVGILVAAPIILAFAPGSPDRERINIRWALELLAILAIIGLVAIPVSYDFPLEYLVILPLLWAAFRLGLAAAAVAVAAVACAAVVVDVAGLGYFARFHPAVSILLVQTFVGAIALVPLLLVPALAERHRAAVREEKLTRDLELARTIQQQLLPADDPTCPGFDIHGWSCPADETGGDYYDWLAASSSRVLLTLGDVTGHGVGPALVAAASRSYVRALAGEEEEIGRLLTRVNDLLFADLPDNRFITLVAASVDDTCGDVKLRSAGQGPICIYRAGSNNVEVKDANDPPIGIMDEYEFGAAVTIRLEPNDVLVLMTDGFIEWPSPDGELYGIERFTDVLRTSASQSAAEIIASLNEAVRSHAAGTEQPDDCTAVVIKRKPRQSGNGKAAKSD